MTLEPLVVEFTVDAEPGRAFDLWTGRTAMWWPKGHTMSGEEDVDIIFDGRPGGRIYERTRDGAEHEWGEIIDWDPPGRITYWWHVFFDRSEATTVEVRFTPHGDSGTAVTITQTGFEVLGEKGVERRNRTFSAWASLTDLYAAACET